MPVAERDNSEVSNLRGWTSGMGLCALIERLEVRTETRNVENERVQSESEKGDIERRIWRTPSGRVGVLRVEASYLPLPPQYMGPSYSTIFFSFCFHSCQKLKRLFGCEPFARPMARNGEMSVATSQK